MKSMCRYRLKEMSMVWNIIIIFFHDLKKVFARLKPGDDIDDSSSLESQPNCPPGPLDRRKCRYCLTQVHCYESATGYRMRNTSCFARPTLEPLCYRADNNFSLLVFIDIFVDRHEDKLMRDYGHPRD
ncbi:unnamed protein product [Clavelina lepadiformis]|uniref:Uncharacterized protein n=1 Tax=Clavelina lepadiformis TaxID=159417 RepID=A0ABP0GGF8_CLALP